MSETLLEFESPRLLLGRAREHIDHLAAEIKAFFDRRPYAHVVETDPKTLQQVYKIRLTAALPARLPAVLKDATSNLRDALDHAVYAAAVTLGVSEPTATGFPFANNEPHLYGELGTWKFTHVPQSIHPVLVSFKPYPGGNDLLVGLNRIRNPNTHRIIVPVGFATMGNEISIAHGTIGGNSQIGYSRWDAAKNEVEFMRLGQGSQMHYTVKASFDVTFGDLEFVGGKPVVATLRKIMAEVNRVVLALEAECARLKKAGRP
jgi:hypothetical protein